MELVIAEKPSVARDIARVLGANGKGDGCLRGPNHVVTWCIGHLIELEEPAAYSPAWKSWKLEALPMLPPAFKLKPSKQTASQWRVVRDLLRSREFSAVINACDAGREGELIFRFCHELSGSRLPIRRLWISSMTDSALRSGFASLRPGAQYDALADAARCRAEADWLVGMNATRAVTTRFRASGGNMLFSIGRVQTPTLALVAERERVIVNFVPRDYWEVTGLFRAPEGQFKATYGHLGQSRLGSLDAAQQLVARLDAHRGKPTGPRIESLDKKTERQPPPLLFDLTSLQRTANKRFGLSAQRTLDIAQALYETHKLVTYPRTDSRFLSNDLRNELPHIFKNLSSQGDYAAFASHLLSSPPTTTSRVFNNARVTDHHAIIPTSKAPNRALDRDEQRIYDLIVRRFLGAFFPDAEFALTFLVVLVGPDAPPPRPPEPALPRDGILDALPPPPDRLHARGKVLLKAGWREVAGLDDDDDRGGGGKDRDGDEEAMQNLPPVARGQALDGQYNHLQKKTRPPPRYTEASLLSAMEFAGREMEDETLRLALKERGLGTPATRASIIETLLKRGYLERRQKQLVPTEVGSSLIDALPVRSLASAELTGEWEARLVRLARGDGSRQDFMRDIADYIREVVSQTKQAAPPAALSAAASGPEIGPCPLCQGPVSEQFKAFQCSRCPFKLWKTIASKKISDKLAAVLLHKRRTQLLSGFRSKAGSPFQAALELDNTGQVRFAFGETSPPPPPLPAFGAARGRPPPQPSPPSWGGSVPTVLPGVESAPSGSFGGFGGVPSGSFGGVPGAPSGGFGGAPSGGFGGVPSGGFGGVPGVPPGGSGAGSGGSGESGGVALAEDGETGSRPRKGRQKKAGVRGSRSTTPLPPGDTSGSEAPQPRGEARPSVPSALSVPPRSPPGVRAGSPAEVRSGSPAEVRSGSPAEVRAGSSAEVPPGVRSGSPAEVRSGSSAEVRAGSPAEVRAGSPAEVRAGSSAEVRSGSSLPTTVGRVGVGASPSTREAGRGGGGGEAEPEPLQPLFCPHCGEGSIVSGKRAWGCSRWRDGCKLVIPFQVGGKQLTLNQLRELITRGRTTRNGKWVIDGSEIKGKLLLDLGSEPPQVRVEAG